MKDPAPLTGGTPAVDLGIFHGWNLLPLLTGHLHIASAPAS